MHRLNRLKRLVFPINVLMVLGLLAISGCVSNKEDLAKARENYDRLERANRSNF